MIAADGRMLGDSDLSLPQVRDVENHLTRPEVQAALNGRVGISRRFSTTLQTDMLYLAVALSGAEPAGVLRLAMPLSEVQLGLP